MYSHFYNTIYIDIVYKGPYYCCAHVIKRNIILVFSTIWFQYRIISLAYLLMWRSCTAELFISMFIHLKLELLTHFPASDDEAYYHLKNIKHLQIKTTQEFKNIRNSSLWTCSHHMAILRNQNKITDFLMISAWFCRLNWAYHFFLNAVTFQWYSILFLTWFKLFVYQCWSDVGYLQRRRRCNIIGPTLDGPSRASGKPLALKDQVCCMFCYIVWEYWDKKIY